MVTKHLQDGKYLADIERLKKLEPILDRLGVEGDKKFIIYADGHRELVPMDKTRYCVSDVKTYRSDTLESVLPRCLISRHIDEALDALGDSDNPLHDFILDNWTFIFDVLIYRDLNDLIDLIILLDENGIELTAERSKDRRDND